MPRELTTVFISSTWQDLVEHREKVKNAVLKAGFHPHMMEHLTASERPPLDKCLSLLGQSDVYVGIIGCRYGSAPPGFKKSYTLLEYEHARRKGIPVYIFLMSRKHSVTSEHVDTRDDAIRLMEFKALLEKRHTRVSFDSPDHLATEVLASLTKFSGRSPNDRIDDGDLNSQLDHIIECFQSFSSPLLN